MMKPQDLINERIAKIIEIFAERKQKKFADAIGISPSVISDLFGKRKNKPGLDMLQKIGTAYPFVSMEWLILGLGDMVYRTRVKPDPGVEVIMTVEERTAKEIERAVHRGETMKALGERLAQVRELYGFSIEEAAEACDMIAFDLQSIEEGRTRFEGRIFSPLAKLYKTNEDLFRTFVLLGMDNSGNNISVDDYRTNARSQSIASSIDSDETYPEREEVLKRDNDTLREENRRLQQLINQADARNILPPEQWEQAMSVVVAQLYNQWSSDEGMKRHLAAIRATAQADVEELTRVYRLGTQHPKRNRLADRLGVTEEEAQDLVLSGKIESRYIGPDDERARRNGASYLISEWAVRAFLQEPVGAGRISNVISPLLPTQ